jgi:predicted chitinase
MARDYKREYRLFQSSPEMIAYRSELNKANADNPNSKKGDKMDMSHKGGKLTLEDESVNRGRSGEGGRKKGPRTRKKRANKGMLVKKTPKMYVEGGVEGVDVGETEEKGLLRRLVNLFRSKEEVSAPMSTVKSTPDDEPVAGISMLPTVEVAEKRTMPFLGMFPEPPMGYTKNIGPLNRLLMNKRMANFQKQLDALGPGYKEAVNAAIFKETGGAGLGKAGYDVAENMSYSTDGRQLANVFYDSFDRLGYGTGERVEGEALGRRSREGGYPVLDTLAIGQDYGRNPEKLGDAMYGDRGGYKYRGRGYLQITNEPMYRKISKDLYGDPNVLVDNPDLILESPQTAQMAAMSYLGQTLKSTVKHIDKQNLLETDKVEDMGQADLNLLVVLQVSGGNLNATTIEGLKKMDASTGVERDYDYLVNNYKTPAQLRRSKKSKK